MMDSRKGAVLFSFFTTNFAGVDVQTDSFGRSGTSDTPTVFGFIIFNAITAQDDDDALVARLRFSKNLSLHF